MHAGIQAIIFIGVVYLIFGIGYYNFYGSGPYQVNQVAGGLEDVLSTTDVERKAHYLEQASMALLEYRGNPEWWYPTTYTSFDNIKETLVETRAKSLELSERTDVDSMSYQQALGVIDSTTETLQDRLTTTSDSWQLNPTKNVFNPLIMLIIQIVGLVVIAAVDQKRNKWY